MKLKLSALFTSLALAGASAQPAASQSSVASAKLGTNKVTLTVSGGERLMVANGLPDHTPGQFPNRGNPNTISAQNYSFHIPTSPRTNSTTRDARGWLSGVALNGVPFEPGTAEFWNGRRDWNYEAIGGSMKLGLDAHNAHVQPTGAYHYHGVPAGLIAKLGGDQSTMLLIGWAADGFPIYTSRGRSTAMDSKSPLKQMRSSWQLRNGDRTGGPDGKFDGSFTADYEYAPGSGDLDECNGRFGVTPEFPQGTYYYCVTGEFPFIARKFKGVPDESFSKRANGGPGGSNGPGPRGPRGPRNGRPPGPPDGFQP